MIARALLSVLAIWANRNRHRLRTDEEGRRRMSEQWRGHYARCLECENLCASGEPCRCCLTAEVEALRNSLGHCAAENATLRENDVLWRSRMKTAEAQVQRVRDMCDGIEPDHSVFVGDVLDALNGGRR